jgi:hypothetical protein
MALILAIMKTLIVHPEDDTTKFLTGIYATLTNKTIITGGVTKVELQKHIDVNDRVLLLGHGTPMGLLSMNRFPDCGSYIIDYSMVESIRSKKNNVFIWCNSDEFVHRHSLEGVYSGMFVSELCEAWCFDFLDIDQDSINESNNEFSAIVSKHIDERVDVFYKNVIAEYGVLAKRNPIALFNLNRLYLTISDHNVCPIKVGNTL